MGKSSDKSPGERIAQVLDDYDLSTTDISRRLGVEYTGLSHFHNGRRASLPGRKAVADYIALLEELTGKSAADLGLDDLVQGAAA